MKKKSLFLEIIILTVFVISFAIIVFIKNNNYKEQQRFEKLQQEIEQNLSKVAEEEIQKKNELQINTEEEQEEIVDQEPKILRKYENIFEENNDLYGWITIEETCINYPVMQTPSEQNFYLRKNWDKEYSLNGLPFADAKVTSESNNIIIYGHNMNDGSMFGSLPNYKDYSFYEEHKYIQFDTLYEESTYEIICVSKTVAYYTLEKAQSADYYFYFHINMDSAEEFNEYVSKAKENAYFETGVSAEFGDELLTLSTCDYWTQDARLLIIAKKVK